MIDACELVVEYTWKESDGPTIFYESYEEELHSTPPGECTKSINAIDVVNDNAYVTLEEEPVTADDCCLTVTGRKDEVYQWDRSFDCLSGACSQDPKMK